MNLLFTFINLAHFAISKQDCCTAMVRWPLVVSKCEDFSSRRCWNCLVFRNLMYHCLSMWAVLIAHWVTSTSQFSNQCELHKGRNRTVYSWVYFAPFQTDTQVTVLLCWALFDLKTPILFCCLLGLILLCIIALLARLSLSTLVFRNNMCHCSYSDQHVPVFKPLWAALTGPQRMKRFCLQIALTLTFILKQHSLDSCCSWLDHIYSI